MVHAALLLTALLAVGASTAAGLSVPAPKTFLPAGGLAAEATPEAAVAAAQSILQERASLLGRPDAAIERGLRDLQAAGFVVRAVDSGDEAAQAMRLAAIASGRVGTLDAAPATPRHALPSGALLALLEPNGASTDPAPLAALDTLPEPLRGDLALLVDMFIAFEDANLQAAAPSSADGLASILSARQGFLEAVAAFQASAVMAGTIPCIGPLSQAPVFSIELGDCPATSYCNPAVDYLLLIDMAGNDKYCNNAGGNGAPNCAAPLFPAAALIDIWGNDLYTPTNPGGGVRGCGVNGGGYRGSGLLVDVFGDDIYIAGSQGTNGGAQSQLVPSAGALIDVFGNDQHHAGFEGTNGGAHFHAAAGLLVDFTGSDTYTAGSYGTNGGAAGGEAFGHLIDVFGDDDYTAEFYGVNGGGASLAHGFLVDLFGNDDYIAQEKGVNGGAQQANGFLLDGTEDDTYTALGLGTNGGAHSGVGVGVGILIDVIGNDKYTATGNGTNGGARSVPGSGFFAFGLLVDSQGNDEYTDNDGFGTNGGGFGQQAVGTLVDLFFGVDTYTGPAFPVFNGQNGAGDANGVGLLVDIGGVGDKYCDAYNLGCALEASLPAKSSSGLTGAQHDL